MAMPSTIRYSPLAIRYLTAPRGGAGAPAGAASATSRMAERKWAMTAPTGARARIMTLLQALNARWGATVPVRRVGKGGPDLRLIHERPSRRAHACCLAIR